MANMKPLVQSAPSDLTVDYQRLFTSLPNRYIVFKPDDPVFTIVAENQAHADIAMVKPQDIIGRPLFEVFPDTSEQYVKNGISSLAESLRTVMRTKKPDVMTTLHYNIPRPDGTMATKYWRVTHYPMFDDSGEVALLYQATVDITDEITHHDTLTRTQQQLDEALSLGLIGTWQWDIEADIITGGKNMAAMFGLDPATAQHGLPLSEIATAIHDDDRRKVLQTSQAAMKVGDTIQSEYRTINANGLVRWLISRGHVDRDKAGKPIRATGILIDITDRKLTENNLSYLAKASEVLSASLDYKQTLQTIAKLMVPDIADWCGIEILNETTHQLEQVAVAHKDPAKVKWARELRNQQGPQNLDASTGTARVLRTGKAEFYPYISEQIIQASAATKKELKLIHDLALTSVIIVPLKINGKTVGAISLITTDGKRQYTESDLEMANELASRASLAMSNASLYKDAQNELASRKRLEEELRIANEELEARVEARTAELEATNRSLQQSNQELQDFAYVASHDLQEPLRKIQAFGNLLETEYGPSLGEGNDYLTRMRGAAKRMSALIEDILSFSRVATKGRGFTPVNLRTVAEEVVSDLEIRIADNHAIVDIGTLPTIHADPMQMRQLLQNLIANALKFHRDGVAPIIKVRATTESADGHSQHDTIKYCRLEIEDNGLGFDEKYLDRIFAVFQRLHSRENYEGTGIGLAVCRKIVERHGGTITARSKLGQGSTFIIRLPMRHKKGETL